MLALARAIDDTAHDRNVHALNVRVALTPDRHFGADEALDLVRQILEHGRGGTPAARARCDQWHKGTQAHGLQNFLADDDFARAVATGLGRQRYPDGIANAVLQ